MSNLCCDGVCSCDPHFSIRQYLVCQTCAVMVCVVVIQTYHTISIMSNLCCDGVCSCDPDFSIRQYLVCQTCAVMVCVVVIHTSLSDNI